MIGVIAFSLFTVLMALALRFSSDSREIVSRSHDFVPTFILWQRPSSPKRSEVCEPISAELVPGLNPSETQHKVIPFPRLTEKQKKGMQYAPGRFHRHHRTSTRTVR